MRPAPPPDMPSDEEESIVQILFQAHHAVISDHMRARAERTVRKLARKISCL